jgi:ribonuclease E
MVDAAAQAAGTESATGGETPGADATGDEPRRARGARKGRRGGRASRDEGQAAESTTPSADAPAPSIADDSADRASVVTLPTITEAAAPAATTPVADASAASPVASTPVVEKPERSTEPRRSRATVSTPDATVAILDIPVATTRREPRRISKDDAEQLLDSVLGALPEPKQPGQGRGRSRRASSSGTAPAAAPAATPSDESGPFILGVGVSSDDL